MAWARFLNMSGVRQNLLLLLFRGQARILCVDARNCVLHTARDRLPAPPSGNISGVERVHWQSHSKFVHILCRASRIEVPQARGLGFQTHLKTRPVIRVLMAS